MSRLNRIFLTGIVVILAGLGAVRAKDFEKVTITDPKTGKPLEVVKGEIIVKYKRGVAANRKAALAFNAKAFGAPRPILGMNAETLTVPEDKVQDALAYYAAQPEVEYAEPNAVAKLFLNFNDALAGQYGNAKIQLTSAWDVTTGTGLPTVKVAVLDTGVNYNHEDLGQGFGPNFLVYGGIDYVQNDSDPLDDHGHGSFVSGIIAGTKGNTVGVAGVSSGVKILAVKVCSNGNDGCPFNAIANGIRYATEQGVHVMNLSLGGTFNSSLLRDAVANALAAKITVVAAAGNDASGTPSYPAAYSGVIAVAASNSADSFASFSNFGKHITLAAPGESIIGAADLVSIPPNPCNVCYSTASGTSFSSPYVAGVAALMLGIQPKLTPYQVATILALTSDDISSVGRDLDTGAGRLNAFKALKETQKTGPLGAPPVNESVPMPNPFIATGSNFVTFRVPENFGTTVGAVQIYNALGQPVRTLSGTNVWDGKNDDGREVASGVYFYELQTPGSNSKNKLVLIR